MFKQNIDVLRNIMEEQADLRHPLLRFTPHPFYSLASIPLSTMCSLSALASRPDQLENYTSARLSSAGQIVLLGINSKVARVHLERSPAALSVEEREWEE